jgi:hypothetical protein
MLASPSDGRLIEPCDDVAGGCVGSTADTRLTGHGRYSRAYSLRARACPVPRQNTNTREVIYFVVAPSSGATVRERERTRPLAASGVDSRTFERLRRQPVLLPLSQPGTAVG